MPQPQLVGLFGLPTQEGVEKSITKKMASASTDLKAHVSGELRVPKILVSAAAIALILWLWEHR